MNAGEYSTKAYKGHYHMIIRMLTLILILILGGCSDPVSSYINKKWDRVSVNQARQTAIVSTAETLSTMTSPNIAASFNIEDIKKILDTEIKQIPDIKKVEISGDEQLIQANIQFSKKFTEADVKSDATLANLLKKLHPKIDGQITIYFGVTSGVVTDINKKEIVLKLLPVFHSIHVDKVVIADKINTTIIGDALAKVLTKYSENISGKISNSPKIKMGIVIPTEFAGTINPNQLFPIADKSVQGNLKITGTPIASPVRLLAVAWLITDKNIRALVQFVPVADSNPKDNIKIEPSFSKIKDRFDTISTEFFGIPDDSIGTWTAIKKDLISFILNSTMKQAAICTNTSIEMAPVTSSNKISFPDADKIDCSTDDSCYSKRSCDVATNHDTRDCSTCLVPSPQVCAFGGCIGGGGCVTKGNDPLCESLKAAQNIIYKVDAEARRADCNRLVLQENTACELQRAGQKALCEGGKATLKAIDKTGNFANIDITIKNAKTEDLQVCFKQFTLASDLSNIQLLLDIQGKASANIDVKFTPLDVVGHLACQFPWSNTKQFSAQLRKSQVLLSSEIKFDHTNNTDRMLFTTNEQTIPVLLQPSPTEYLLTNVDMTLACQGLNLIKPIALSATPFVPELRGVIDYKLPSQKNIPINLPLPSQEINDQIVTASLKDTGKALGVFATVTKK